MLTLRLVYTANIIVTGWISFTCLFYPTIAQVSIFSNTVAYSSVIRLNGSLWAGIFVLSVAGLWFPQNMQLILLFQLVYKSLWLLCAALPAIIKHQPYPKGMAVFFIVWVLVLPGVIDWKFLFNIPRAN